MTDLKPIVAVGVVCVRGQDEVLLIQRGTEPRKGEWSIPGGKLDLGARLKDCAARELLEETGVTARIGDLLDVFDGLFLPQKHYVLVDYLATWVSGEPRAGDDAAEACFFGWDEALEKVGWSSTRQVLEQARALVRGQQKAPI